MADYSQLDENSDLKDLLEATGEFDNYIDLDDLVDYLGSLEAMGRISITFFAKTMSTWEKSHTMLSLTQSCELRSIQAYAYYRVVTDEIPMPEDFPLDIVLHLAKTTLNDFDNDRKEDTDALGKISVPRLTGAPKFQAFEQAVHNLSSIKLSPITKKPLNYLCRGEKEHAPLEDADGMDNELGHYTPHPTHGGIRLFQ